MKRSTRNILLAVVATFLLLVALFLYNLFGPSPAIVVSPQTTWLTQPLADDGLPDYARYLLDQQREGVTPENNAAIPFLQAMWPAELEPEHQAVVCAEVGMDIPAEDGVVESELWSLDGDSVIREVTLLLLANRGIAPPQSIETHEQYKAWKQQWRQENQDNQSFAFDEDPTAETGFLSDGFESEVAPFDDAEFEADELIGRCHASPWKAEQLPLLAAWVQRNQTNYNLLTEATQRPKFYRPPAELLVDPNAHHWFGLIPTLQSLRGANRVLNLRAMLRLGEQDYAGSWEDCRAMYLLADHTPSDTIVGEFVRIACRDVANVAAQEILNEMQIPVDVARSIHRFMLSRSQERTMSIAVDTGERLGCLQSIMGFSEDREGSSDPSELDESLEAIEILSVDWNITLERMNKSYDQIVAALEVEDYQQRQDAISQLEAKLASLQPEPAEIAKSVFSRSARSELVSDAVEGLLFPSITSASAAEDRAVSQLRLMQVAAALAVYRCENGDYPESLEALIPSLIPKTPVDLYHGKPLAYKKTEAGYLLVELGPNGVDDGGSNEQSALYRGYRMYDIDQADLSALLGEEPLGEHENLEDRIPAGADDEAIRMPLPKADWSELDQTDTARETSSPAP